MTNANADPLEPARPALLADLRLDDIVVESLRLRTNFRTPRSIGGSAESPVLEVSVDILQAGNDLRFLISMTIRLNRQKADLDRFGYALDLDVLGFFSFPEGTSEHHVAHLIRLNAPSILYGVARGIAAQALALTPAGRVFLPSVNFVEIMKQRSERRRRSRRGRSASD
jgi:preprotein translocase subunit SecB